jgi:anti-sigma factor RsiW
MCDFSRQLMAWLDGELPANEAGDVERHVQLCPQCRARVESYRQVSGAFEEYCDRYCDVVTASAPRRQSSRRVLTIWEAAGLTAAAVAVLFLLAARARVHLSPLRAPAPAAGMAIASPSNETTQATKLAQAKAGAQAEETDWAPTEPALEIAIPADAILPPGAAPEGVSFDADVTIAPDGSAQQVRLRPRLTEFERRPTQP